MSERSIEELWCLIVITVALDDGSFGLDQRNVVFHVGIGGEVLREHRGWERPCKGNTQRNIMTYVIYAWCWFSNKSQLSPDPLRSHTVTEYHFTLIIADSARVPPQNGHISSQNCFVIIVSPNNRGHSQFLIRLRVLWGWYEMSNACGLCFTVTFVVTDYK